MKKLILSLAVVAVCLMAYPSRFLAVQKIPAGAQYVITAEYTPYKKLMEPEVVGLFKKYGVAVNLFVRENQIGDDLDKLLKIYADNGVRVIWQPFLPMKDGLYVNKKSATTYLKYLDVVYNWADAHGHKIDAILVDIEPSYVELKPGEKQPGPLKGLKRLTKDMGKESFDASIPVFQQIVDKIHRHGSLAIAATFPYVVDDKLKGRHAWEDLFGGPVATLDWDVLAIMMYTSWYVEFAKRIGVNWDASHYLAYEYSRDMKRLWGDKAAAAVGVTNPGTGHEKVIYTSAAQIAPAVAAVKAAGIENVGIYDLKGILASDDPESWFKVLVNTPPQIPTKGKMAAHRLRRIFRIGGSVLETMR